MAYAVYTKQVFFGKTLEINLMFIKNKDDVRRALEFQIENWLMTAIDPEEDYDHYEYEVSMDDQRVDFTIDGHEFGFYFDLKFDRRSVSCEQIGYFIDGFDEEQINAIQEIVDEALGEGLHLREDTAPDFVTFQKHKQTAELINNWVANQLDQLRG